MRRIGNLKAAGMACAVLVVVLSLFAGMAGAQQPTPAAPLTLEQLRWNDVQQKLGLTTDQVTALQTIMQTSRATMKQDVQNVKAAHQALRAAWETANPGSIQTAHQQTLTAKAQLSTDRLNTQLQIFQVLGPDLYKQWHALHHHGRHGWGHGFGPGL